MSYGWSSLFGSKVGVFCDDDMTVAMTGKRRFPRSGLCLSWLVMHPPIVIQGLPRGASVALVTPLPKVLEYTL